MTGTGTYRGTWRRLRAGTLLAWLLLPLLGCGSTLQAEDATTVSIVQRARELYDQGEFAAAKEKANLAVNRSPDNPQARYVRALANLKLNEFALAREDLERAQQIDPLAMFAASKPEFDKAMQTAIENTAQALDGGPITTPPPPGEKAEKTPDQPSDKPDDKPKPEPTDPVAKALAAAGAVMEDRSGKGVLGDPQKRSMNKIVQTLQQRGLTVKFLVIAPGTDPEAEAQRLAAAAGLGSRDLLIVAQPPDKVVGYTATLTPDAIRAEIAEALADAGDASLARRMILAANAVGSRLQVPPDAPPAEGQTEPVPAPTPEPLRPDRAGAHATSPVPLPPPPASGPPMQLVAGVAGGIVALLLVWSVLAKVLRKRRLGQGFAMASPHLREVADRLAAVSRRLLAKYDRQASASLAAAELAYFDAVAMMSAADEEDTGDIARVERAERLLAEADTKLGEAEQRLPDDAAEAEAAACYCWFTGKPLGGRWDGDLVKLTQGDDSRLVLAARTVGAAIRRGETPQVRAVARDGLLLHWADVAGFEPLVDFYRTDRFGWHHATPGELRLDLSSEPQRPLYVEIDERPDFTVAL